MATDELIRTVLRTRWQHTPQHIAALADGSWRVRVDGRHLLVTLTPAAQHARLLAGLSVAEHLSQSGLPAGRPVRAVDGAPTVPVEDGLSAVVHDVPGRPPAADRLAWPTRDPRALDELRAAMEEIKPF